MPSDRLGDRDTPVTMSIPTAQILASKYYYSRKETLLGEIAGSSARTGKKVLNKPGIPAKPENKEVV